MTPPTILHCHREVFTEPRPSSNRVIYIETHRLSSDRTRAAQRTNRPTILLFFHEFIAAGTCLPSHCVAMIEGNMHTTTQTKGRDL
jgi:hypothetical protein